MNSGVISDNSAIHTTIPGTGYGLGGGVFVWQATFNMANGSITKNTATYKAGGLLSYREVGSSATIKVVYKKGTITGNSARSYPNTQAVNGATITTTD